MADAKPAASEDTGEEKKKVSLSPEPEGFSEDPLAFDDETDGLLDGFAEELNALRNERDEMKDRMLRALAEAENMRKRSERDRRDAELYGGTRLARDLLAVHDNMRRALDAVDDELREKASALIEGIELTQRELLSAFKKHHIEKVEPEYGDKFDPQTHQAMFEAPVPNAPAGTVIQVMNAGFMIGERLLRPAQVGVSSTPASEIKSAAPDTEQDEKES